MKEKGFYLSITDVYSRYTSVIFLTEITSENLIESFKRWIKKFGAPKKVISDNGKQYTSKIFKDFLEFKKVRLICTPTYHLSSNGISERLNQTIAEVLRIYKGISIGKVTEKINRRLNINYHRGVGESPTAIISGYSEFDFDKKRRNYTRNIKNDEEKNKNIRDINVNRRNNRLRNNIQLGDRILIRNFKRNKIEDVFNGPYKVINIGEKKFWFKVEGINEWIHVDDIKLYLSKE